MTGIQQNSGIWYNYWMKISIPEDTTILEALRLVAPDSSNTTLRSWIKAGRVTVDSRPIDRSSAEVKKGQVIELLPRVAHAEGGIRILYEDRSIIVIDKPEGLLTVATDFEERHTAHAYLKERYGSNSVHVVHRIDRDTSGVMLFARSDAARTRLKNMFEKHDLDREYHAVVEGHLSERKGTWTSWLYEDANYNVRTTRNKDKGRRAVTHYEVLAKKGEFSYLRFRLETGRKHQIRVHCAEAGHPVVGDPRYGGRKGVIKRLALHAHRLAFKHPFTNKFMEFRSPVPPQIARFRKR